MKERTLFLDDLTYVRACFDYWIFAHVVYMFMESTLRRALGTRRDELADLTATVSLCETEYTRFTRIWLIT